MSKLPEHIDQIEQFYNKELSEDFPVEIPDGLWDDISSKLDDTPSTPLSASRPSPWMIFGKNTSYWALASIGLNVCLLAISWVLYTSNYTPEIPQSMDVVYPSDAGGESKRTTTNVAKEIYAPGSSTKRQQTPQEETHPSSDQEVPAKNSNTDVQAVELNEVSQESKKEQASAVAPESKSTAPAAAKNKPEKSGRSLRENYSKEYKDSLDKLFVPKK